MPVINVKRTVIKNTTWQEIIDNKPVKLVLPKSVVVEIPVIHIKEIKRSYKLGGMVEVDRYVAMIHEANNNPVKPETL